MSERYQLNKELAQMLKGGVIMDVTNLSRQKLQKLQEPVQLWHLKESQQTLELPAVFQE